MNEQSVTDVATRPFRLLNQLSGAVPTLMNGNGATKFSPSSISSEHLMSTGVYAGSVVNSFSVTVVPSIPVTSYTLQPVGTS